MNYTRILFTIALAGVTMPFYAMKRDATHVLKISKNKQKKTYQEKLAAAKCWITKELSCYANSDWEDNPDIRELYDMYLGRVARIALKSPDMPDLEKLENLYGDYRYEFRKKIIISLVDSGVNPNHVIYQRQTALEESIEKKDVEFAQFLLKAGAKPSQKDIVLVQRSSSKAIKGLFFDDLMFSIFLLLHNNLLALKEEGSEKKIKCILPSDVIYTIIEKLLLYKKSHYLQGALQ